MSPVEHINGVAGALVGTVVVTLVLMVVLALMPVSRRTYLGAVVPFVLAILIQGVVLIVLIAK